MPRRFSLQPPDLAEQALSRTTGAELIRGNSVRLLRDGSENYPAWEAAIQSAKSTIHIETYIFFEDVVGRQFADLLSAKAAEGVRVRVLYDWFGTWGRSSRRFWRHLVASGVEVRCFNPPAFESPLACLSRNHRKIISVDGCVGYVSGLCFGQVWIGDEQRQIEPWRDTGVEVRGPAVAQIDIAFAQSWATAGTPMRMFPYTSAENAGDISVRVIASVPSAGSVYRMDQLVTSLARHSIWLSDAYFAGTSSYIHSLRGAATAGVDVRLLIPGNNDVPLIRAVSRAGLRPLLEAGVRIFEWNGSMMHAKTAVVDGCWARVGSTNLNVASWLGNWELDVVIENASFGRKMEEMYLEDLAQSTEIVLKNGRRRRIAKVHSTGSLPVKPAALRATRTAAGVIRLGRTVGAAIAGSRELGSAEAVVMLWSAALLLLLAITLLLFPKILVMPMAVLSAWLAFSLVFHAIKLWRRR
jgi:cardiolipin synthase A/B